jgi:ANTAR domain
MERHAIDEAGAFEMLRERSRIDNRKLIDLAAAAAVVDGHRLLPKQPQAPDRPPRLRRRCRDGRLTW